LTFVATGHPGRDEEARLVPLAMGLEESKGYIEKMTGIYKELAEGLKK